MPFYIILVILTVLVIYNIEKEEPEQVMKSKTYLGIQNMPIILIYMLAVLPITQMLLLVFYGIIWLKARNLL